MKKYLSELIGTYGLVFFGTGAIVINDQAGGVITHLGVAIAFGLVVMAMIYAFGQISGAHINPAVTIAFWYSKSFPGKEVLPYIISQLTGGLLASATLWFVFPFHPTLGSTIPSDTALQSFILEVILTFFLMIVIINVSTGSKEIGVLAGIAIGATVLLEALVAGPITGASMNPVRSIAPAVFSGKLTHLWIYITAPVIGALLAILANRILKK